MKAVLFEEFKSTPKLVETNVPTVAKTGVVLEVKACGICRSDWHGWQGHDADIVLPHVPGHEIAGVIAEVGADVKKWKVGERVTLPFVGGCGSCGECESGNQQVCDYQFQPGFTAWGGFAEFVAIDYADENLVSLPAEIGFVEAAALGCRFITSFRAVVDQGKVSKDQCLAVFGCGGVGLSALMIGKALGARTLAIDIDDGKLSFAKSLGVDAVFNSATNPEFAQEIVEISQGGVHLSIDALGHPSVVRSSVHILRKRGKHVQVGLLNPRESEVDIPVNRFVAKEIEFIGSHGMQAHRYERMFDLIRDRGMDLSALVGREVSLDDSVEILVNMESFPGNGINVIVF